jgi:hypothetical protein
METSQITQTHKSVHFWILNFWLLLNFESPINTIQKKKKKKDSGEEGMGARTQAAQQRAKHMDEKWQHFHQKFDFYLTLFYFSFPWPGPLLIR